MPIRVHSQHEIAEIISSGLRPGGPYPGRWCPSTSLLILEEDPHHSGRPGPFPARRLGLDGRVRQTGPDIAEMQPLEACATILPLTSTVRQITLE